MRTSVYIACIYVHMYIYILNVSKAFSFRQLDTRLVSCVLPLLGALAKQEVRHIACPQTLPLEGRSPSSIWVKTASACQRMSGAWSFVDFARFTSCVRKFNQSVMRTLPAHSGAYSQSPRSRLSSLFRILCFCWPSQAKTVVRCIA